MTEPGSSSIDPRISLKAPWIAGLLAFLVPGAGHLYQGRVFKAVIYSVCILGTFFFGVSLADGKAVHNVVYDETPRGRIEPGHYTRSIGYFCQFPVGLPALPALLQHSRFDNALREQEQAQGGSFESLSASFEGAYFDVRNTPIGIVRGNLSLRPVLGDIGLEQRGTVSGTLHREGGQTETISLKVAGPVRLQQAVFNDPQRLIACEVVEDQQGKAVTIGTLEGAIPRSLFNRYQVPLEDRQLENLNRKLGKRLEIAMVFTWIAGLLNLLAIWDAVDGPAYGYGDESPDENQPGNAAKPGGSNQSETALAANTLTTPATFPAKG